MVEHKSWSTIKQHRFTPRILHVKHISYEKIELIRFERKFQGLQLSFSSIFHETWYFWRTNQCRKHFFSIRAYVKVTLQAMLSIILVHDLCCLGGCGINYRMWVVDEILTYNFTYYLTIAWYKVSHCSPPLSWQVTMKNSDS